jgi:hypothetical protein
MPREQKITLGEMRESGPCRLLVYCADYKCAHHNIIQPPATSGDGADQARPALELFGASEGTNRSEQGARPLESAVGGGD